MDYKNTPYDAVGVAIIQELFKQVEEVAPMSDITPRKPSVLKRLLTWGKPNTHVVYPKTGLGSCDDEMKPQPSL